MILNRRNLLAGAGLIGAAPRLIAAPPTLIPLQTFADKPPMAGLVLSPDGEMVLARMQVKGAEMLGTYRLATHEFVNYALPQGADLNWYRWAGPNRFIASLGMRIIRRTQSLYAEGYISRLYTFDLITKTAGYIGPKDWTIFTGDDVIFLDPDGEYLLLALPETTFDWPAVVRYDLKTSVGKVVMPAANGVFQFFCDETGTVRAQRGVLDGHWFVTYRPDAKSSFKRIATGDTQIFHSDPFVSLAFTSGSDKGYILSDASTGRIAAYRYDFGQRAQGEAIFTHPANDVSSLAFDGRENILLGVRYTDDRERTDWVDPMFADLQAGVDRAMPGRYNEIRSWSEDRSRILLFSGASNHRGRYYVFQSGSGKLSPLLDMGQDVAPAHLSTMRSVHYRARDGLEIPAFLTLPADRDAKGLPLVIMPHGGPYGIRDTLQYDALVQFLANRGYVVLQPNYRGSDSYGAEFSRRGSGEWGRKMQDDLDDGMDWLVGQNMVDPKRACLVGASYGGYAAAWGATRNPERYRCAACFAGVFDLGEQLDYSSDFLSNRTDRQYRRMIKGDGPFSLSSVSPRSLIDRLQVPVLLMHGEEDNVVPVSQSKSYHAGLTRRNKPHEFYLIPKEVHGFTQAGSFTFYLTKLEAFLAAHNPA